MSQETSTRSNIEPLAHWNARGLNTALVRVGVALVLWLHALGRLGIGPRSGGSVSGLGGFLGTLGIPAPQVMAWVVMLVEVVGGLFLLVGFLVRVSALLVAIDMFVAFSLVHWPAGFAEQSWQIELTGLMVLLALSLVVSGPGNLSLDSRLFGENTSAEERLLDR